MRRLAWFAAALAAACGSPATPEAGPLDRIFFPTGMAVHDGRLLVASSNSDLRFAIETGGAVMALDIATLLSDPVRVAGTLNVGSLAGDLAVADPAVCTSVADPLAIFAMRGSNTLDVLRLRVGDPTNELSRDRAVVALSGPFGDPLAVTVACGAGRSRAFIGYLRATSSEGWITEYDLVDRTLRNMAIGTGPVRGFAYDATRDRLYVIGLATGTPTPLRWIDLAGCEIGAPAAAGGCTVGEASLPALPSGLELRSMALANDSTDPNRRRAYLTGRYYDLTSAAAAGGRTVDFGGALLVVDLVENALGGVDVELVNDPLDFGRGAQDVRVLPPTAARAGMRDVVVALAVDAGQLLVYDDETRDWQVIGSDEDDGLPPAPDTGAPDLGAQPFGLAVDPVVASTVARVYVGSFAASYVTPVDVPLDTSIPATIVKTPSGFRRITGGTTQ